MKKAFVKKAETIKLVWVRPAKMDEADTNPVDEFKIAKKKKYITFTVIKGEFCHVIQINSRAHEAVADSKVSTSRWREMVKKSLQKSMTYQTLPRGIQNRLIFSPSSKWGLEEEVQELAADLIMEKDVV